MMNEFGDDLVERSLAMLGEETDGIRAADRKARLMASIANLKTDAAEQARIDRIAADAGIEADEGDSAPAAAPGYVAPPQAQPGDLYTTGSSVPVWWKRVHRRLLRSLRERKAIKRAGDYLAWLGGADKALLEQVPQERGRFAQMAGVLITTAGIAVISMIFALHDAVTVPLLPSIVLGLLWGIVILNIDRFLVLSMGFTRDRWRLIWITLPRLALAVVLALVISTPLVLRIFASDINAQLFTMQAERSKQQAVLLAGTAQAQEADRLREQISADQAILAGHLPVTVTSPQLQTAQARVNNLQAQAQRDHKTEIDAFEAWQCQLAGQTCTGGSGVAGNGPLARAAEQQYQQAQSVYNSTESQLNSAQAAVNVAETNLSQEQGTALARYQAQARQALPALQNQYSALEARLQVAAEDGNRLNVADTGILAQLQALAEVSAHSPSLEAARLVVLMLFLFIEILPVTVKFLLNLGSPSAYEAVAKLKEDERVKSVRIRLIEEHRIEEARSQIRINVESDMRRREKDLGKRANEHVAGEMQRILDAALQEWSNQVRAKMASDSQASISAWSPGDGPPDYPRFLETLIRNQ
jgi:hypothetical protein